MTNIFDERSGAADRDTVRAAEQIVSDAWIGLLLTAEGETAESAPAPASVRGQPTGSGKPSGQATSTRSRGPERAGLRRQCLSPGREGPAPAIRAWAATRAAASLRSAHDSVCRV